MLIQGNLYLNCQIMSNNHNNQTGCELFTEAGVHVILNIIETRFFFVFMASSDDLNGAVRFGSILQAASVLQARKGIEDVFCHRL